MQCGITASDEMLDAYLSRATPSGTPLWNDIRWGCFLKMGPVKLFIDGTLGGHTAWMRQPYRDKPESRGFPVLDEGSLNRFVQKAAAGGMQVFVHAIGDAGMDAAISAFERIAAQGENAGGNPLRHGIIHCQISTPDILERMARNKILALVQPVFLADDARILESRVGPQLASTSYAWGSMHRLGIPVSYSTDAPVSALDPLLCIEWAVLRRDNPGEQVDVPTAIDAYTAASAFSSFDEASLGRIERGYLADLVFIDRDIFAIAPDEMHKARVLRTMCAGETVYLA
jgi:predicted amidohydrolase YtcJ